MPLIDPLNTMNPWILPETFTADYDFEGIVSLNNCSGSLVRFENSKDSDFAMVLTNGHCIEGKMMAAGAHIAGKKSKRSFGLLNKTAKKIGTVLATEIIYGTMTKTDMAIYRLAKTYEQIAALYHLAPLTLSSKPYQSKTSIEIISGYWQLGYRCEIDGIVHKLKEDKYTWEQSIRYSLPGCETIHGTSGSPIIEAGKKIVIGVNNTGNDEGKKCTLDNPCEIDENGTITYKKGTNYGQQIAWIYDCLDSNNQLDLTLKNCQLPGAQPSFTTQDLASLSVQ